MAKQEVFNAISRINVDSTRYVATVVLVIETTVDYMKISNLGVVIPIEEFVQLPDNGIQHYERQLKGCTYSFCIDSHQSILADSVAGQDFTECLVVAKSRHARVQKLGRGAFVHIPLHHGSRACKRSEVVSSVTSPYGLH